METSTEKHIEQKDVYGIVNEATYPGKSHGRAVEYRGTWSQRGTIRA
jgi:hypothetical protein